MNAATQTIEAEGWELAVHAGEPVVEDTALATHLDHDKRKLRELIRTYRDAKHITPIAREERTGGRGRPGEGYLLNEPDALFVVTRSNAPRAIEITKQMIRVFIAARRAMNTTSAPMAPSSALPADAPRALPAPPSPVPSIRFRLVLDANHRLRFWPVPDSARKIGEEVRMRADAMVEGRYPAVRFCDIAAWPRLRDAVAASLGVADALAYVERIAQWPVPPCDAITEELVRYVVRASAMHERAS